MTADDRGERELSSALTAARVLVVGDVMLDEYIWGDVARVSPEAPVPLVESTGRTSAPGGAANVARGAAALGAGVVLGGVVGDDATGLRLRSVLEACGLAGDGLLVSAGRITTSKCRVIAGGQHIVRIDREQRDRIGERLERDLIEWVGRHVRDVEAVAISDYDKGVVTPAVCAGAITAARSAGVPVVVDPKGADPRKYRGASVITPNVREAERLVGSERGSGAEHVAGLARDIADLLPDCAVLITRGQDGMLLRSADGRVTTIETEPRSIRDGTGAGDTVVSTIAAAMSGGLDLKAAIHLASRAASVAVTRPGAAVVTLEELVDVVG